MNDLVEFLKMLSITMGILGSAMAFFGSFWVTSISRNPDANTKIFVPGLIVLSCIEIIIISCLGIFFQVALRL
jgi:F0F1-type ATP synthase membrane subunit c/vacuolar-type H+-ATPase subunit K